MGKEFFSRLRRINWTRGSGGTIVGNDEYNSDSYDAGGGANYTKDRFGPGEKKSGSAGYSTYGGGGPFAPMGGRRW
jgi:hypothetical protein